MITRFFKVITILTATVMASTGCGKEDIQAEPTIQISGVSATDQAIRFTISITDADKAAYIVQAADIGTPDAEKVLSDGVRVNADETCEYTADGLEPDTEYFIYVAAKNKKGYAFKTDAIKTYVHCNESFKGQDILAIYYGNRDTRNKDRYNYYMIISDVGFSPEMYPNPDGEFFFRIDLYYDRATDPDNAFIPDGTYELDGLHDEPESGLLGNRSGFYRTDEMSFHKDKHDFESARLNVTSTTEGKRYQLIATLDNGKVYEVTYEGKVAFDNQSGESSEGKKDQLPPITEDISTVFTVGEGSILFQQDGLSQVSLAFSDMAIEDGQLTPPGNLLNINIITVLQDGKIPEKTFTLQNGDSDKNFLIPGQEEYEAGTYYPIFSYIQNYVTSNSSTTGYITGGSVSIKKSSKGYAFNIDLTTKDGHKVKGSYDGEFPLYGPGQSTLTDDYAISFPSDTKATGVFYGDYYTTGTANWLLVLMPESEKGDAFYMECFNNGIDFSKGLAAGIYTPDATGKDMTFLPGEVNDNGQLAYTYYAYVDGQNIYNYAPITGGSVTISKTGDVTTMTIDGIDDSGHKVTGKWSGTLALTDNSTVVSQMSLHRAPVRTKSRISRYL